MRWGALVLSLLALAAAQGAAQPQRALAGVWEGEVDSSAAARRLLAASTQLGQGAGISEADARAVGEATARLMSAGLGGVPQSAQVELGDALTRFILKVVAPAATEAHNAPADEIAALVKEVQAGLPPNPTDADVEAALSSMPTAARVNQLINLTEGEVHSKVQPAAAGLAHEIYAILQPTGVLEGKPGGDQQSFEADFARSFVSSFAPGFRSGFLYALKEDIKATVP